MVEQSPALKNMARVIRSTKRIVVGVDAWMAAWSSDQSTKDGPNAHCIIADELHEWTGTAGREMWGKIRYAGIARRQPLCPLAITTAGDDRYSLCYEQHQYASRIIAGDVVDDLAYYAKIYAADKERFDNDEDYWKTEEAWRRANPAFEIVLKKEDFEADIVEAESDPGEKARFCRYRLNLWIQSSTPWLASGIWAQNAGEPFTEEQLRGQVCFAGLDLSSDGDFTACLYLFPRIQGDQKKFRILARIYCPEDTLKERIKRLDVDLLSWISQGYVRSTPGNVIDHELIFNDIKEDSQKFKIKELGYDRYSAAWIVQQLQAELGHIELFPVNQSMLGMTNATKGVTRGLKLGQFEHNNNPVLDWMAGNAVPFYDSKDNMMLHKGKSKDKIDAIVALIIAYGQAEVGSLVVETKASVYDNDNFARAMLEYEGRDITNEKPTKETI
jgi:phage terminase large subunit-like protein